MSGNTTKKSKKNVTALQRAGQVVGQRIASVRRASRRTVLLTAVVIAVVVGLAVTGMVLHGTSAAEKTAKAQDANAEKYKDTLRDQVDTSGGEPRDGRDPSAQKQTSLSQAASTPNVAGSRTQKPAAGVTGQSKPHATHGDVYGDPSKTGINSAGCYIDYGKPGEQCLQAGLANQDGTLTCDAVRTQFANGIKVSGTDRFHLDHNGDGLACGSGE